jgi:hypothetical protein
MKLSCGNFLCKFYWDQAIVIPSQTGKVLAGEQK